MHIFGVSAYSLLLKITSTSPLLSFPHISIVKSLAAIRAKEAVIDAKEAAIKAEEAALEAKKAAFKARTNWSLLAYSLHPHPYLRTLTALQPHLHWHTCTASCTPNTRS